MSVRHIFPTPGPILLLLAALLVVVFPVKAQPPAPDPPTIDSKATKDWVRREGRWFSYLLPTEKWQAAESANGISISSPSGEYQMTHAMGEGARMSLDQVEVLMLQGSAISHTKIVGRPQTGKGGVETIEFTGLTPLGVPAHGAITAEITGMAFRATLITAPSSRWEENIHLLLTIRKHLTVRTSPPAGKRER